MLIGCVRKREWVREYVKECVRRECVRGCEKIYADLLIVCDGRERGERV